MKLEYKFLIAALVAVILAVPVALAIQNRTEQIKGVRARNSSLHTQLKAREKELQSKALQLEQQKQKTQEVEKQLQSKREEKERTIAQAQQAPVASSGGCESYRSLVAQYNWDVHTAMAVMQAENTACNPVKDNSGLNDDGTVDYGLFQVNSVHSDLVGGNLEALRDPATNIRAAYTVYADAGWTAWSTYNNGAYLAHL